MASSRATLAESSASDGAAALESVKADLRADRARVVDLEAKLARIRREHTEAMETARRELSEAVQAAQRAHAEQLESLRREHAETTESRQKEYAAEITALEQKHAAELESLVEHHDEALRELEAKHARSETALREEHAAAKRVAAKALEEERLTAAKARQQVLAAEGSITALRSKITQAAELLDELARREEMAAALRARAIDQARETLAAEERGPDVAPLDRSGPVPVPPTPRPVVETVSLDEIEIDLAGSPR